MPDSLNPEQIDRHLSQLDGWKLTHDGKRIRKDSTVSNFLAGLEYFGKVAELAEAMQHHPDLHIENYKDVWVEIWTHTVNGLTESDFKLAARIDAL